MLLETAKEDSSNNFSRLFLNPVDELIAQTPDDLDELLVQVDNHTAEGKFVAGYFNYECGEHFVGLTQRKQQAGNNVQPLAWLGIYAGMIEFDHATGIIREDLPAIQSASDITDPPPVISTNGLDISRHDYDARITRIHEYLQAGHTYQVNFTDRIYGSSDAEPLAIYAALLHQQPVPFAAYINTPSRAILSFSPEMFYRVSQGKITARPMKGTWPRGVNTASDCEAARLLQNDEKNRSEHVMIVDLLRNDLGRLCEYGTVRVGNLFSVERYSTLLQMTSSISGTLREGQKPSHIFRTLFPSGSITGAPKRRTMEIIRELERTPRCIYTGAIGYFGPHGESCFNVAIRTLELENKQFTFGVGGGITAGSAAQQEYDECRIKGAFLTRTRPRFSLIETMRCESGISLLDLHMKRLADSADYFDIRYDATQLKAALASSAAECGNIISRVRMELDESGSWKIRTTPLEATPWNGRILLAAERTDSRDVFLHHKTTNRNFYERHLVAARDGGFDEVLFLNEAGQITEGTISNFYFRIKGRWLTPKLNCGVLPGVRRAFLLQNLHAAEECELTMEDLLKADRVFACNALHGERPVHSIQSADSMPLHFAHNSTK